MWANLEPSEVAALQELDSLSDRAAAIVGATILEARLEERLKHAMADLVIKERETLHKRMFNNSGPLGSFSARINIAFMCKIFDESVWRDLNVIRDLRNDFAHVTSIGSFKDRTVIDRCANLKACDAHFRLRQAGDPIMVADEVSVGKTPTFTFFIADLEQKLKDARQRYLLCIMYYAMVLKFPLVVQWAPRFDLPPA